MCARVDAEPRGSSVAILEDEPSVSEDLNREISSLGYSVVGIADNLESFETIVNESNPDAVSIDWSIHGVDQGPDALGFMRREHSSCGLLVYTKHKGRVQGARNWGADEIVIKRSGSAGLDDYMDSIRRAARVGLFRRIANCLTDLGVAVALTLAQLTRPLDHERELFDLSRRTFINRRAEGENPVKLRYLLLRRGWWQAFDLRSFVVLSPSRKLEQLIGPLGLDPPAIAVILGISEESASNLMLGEIPSHGLKREELERVDCLLSVLAHVLRISQYEIEMMPYYWTTKGLYGAAAKQPPWDKQGLCDFLTEKGPSGLADALYWIRR
jgi:DNA-binding NarL/FixJ family response regulator